MKKLFIILILVLGFLFVPVVSQAAITVYPCVALIGGGTGALDKIDGTNLHDKDIAIVVVLGDYTYFYVLDADSAAAEDATYYTVISPNTNAGDKRWILVGVYALDMKTAPSSTSPGQITIQEQSTNGTNYRILTVPASIVSNGTFTLGQWRIDANTVTDADFNIEVDETKTTFVLTIAGLVDSDQAGVLPAATGSGIIFGFYLEDGDATYDFQVQPDSTDTIGNGAAGHYFEAKAIGSYIQVQDVASGKWSMLTELTWTEET